MFALLRLKRKIGNSCCGLRKDQLPSSYRMETSSSVSTTTAGRNEFRLSCMPTWNAS